MAYSPNTAINGSPCAMYPVGDQFGSNHPVADNWIDMFGRFSMSPPVPMPRDQDLQGWAADQEELFAEQNACRAALLR
jgi:hypothetical protein